MKYYQSEQTRISDTSFFTIENISSSPKNLVYNFAFDSYSHDSVSQTDDHDHYINPQLKNNLTNLFSDMFPYFKTNSAVTIILIIEIIVYFLLPQQYLIIRPYYRLSA